jgi:uncharacterized protein (DUF1697 family)
MARTVAFLRGINLGSRRRVAMAELRDLLAGHGYGDVRTLLQSGNVVLTATASGARLEHDLERRLADALGFEIEVVVRTRDQLAAVVKRNPLADVADHPSRYLVNFLSAKPAARVLRELEEADVAPERLVVSGREIYTWHPKGLQRSALAKLLSGDRLGVKVTNRNWSTVTKLLALADG